MAKKEFKYRGKTLDELKAMSLNEFMEIIPSRARRTLKRGFTEDQNKLLEKIRLNKKNLKTHSRDMVIIPEMLGHVLKIYNGNSYVEVKITEEMLGHFLGEFSLTRKRISHNAPGVGATRSSASISVR